MELTKCPLTGFKGYELRVNCKCVCHTPGYTFVFLNQQCCQCDGHGLGKASGLVSVWVYPLDQFTSNNTLKRIEAFNNSNISKYPELLELIKINNLYL